MRQSKLSFSFNMSMTSQGMGGGTIDEETCYGKMCLQPRASKHRLSQQALYATVLIAL